MQEGNKRLYSLLRIALAVAMLVYLGKSGFIDWASLAGLADAWYYSLLAVCLFMLASIMMAWRLQILVNAHHLSLSFRSAVRLTFIGIFFNTYLPGSTGGDLVKIYYASKGNPGKRAEVVTILFLDRFIGMFCLLAVPLVLSPFFTGMVASQKILQGLLLTSLGVTLGIMAVVVIGAWTDLENSRFFERLFDRLPLGGLLRRVLHTLHYYRNRKRVILLAIAFSFTVQLLMIGVSLLVALAILPGGPDVRMIMLVPLGYLATSLPVTPGGLGVGEAALESLFNLFGLQGGAEILLGWRLVMVVVGLLGLVYYLKGEKRFVFSATPDGAK